MLFFDNKKKTAAPKPPSVAGFLLKPDIGGSVRPVAESIGMFVKLIAWIFAANKLFPANHPALAKDSKAPLTMGEILETAWNSLSFTREGTPQILLFVAVVGCLVFSGLIVITFFASLLIGHAHAATLGSGMFDTPSPSTDIAYNFLDYLFTDGSVTNLTASGIPMVDGKGIQSALKKALAFYSNGILVFAGFILLYHLVHMVAETAHSGTPFGKNTNQIWAPIRLVFAIGLLVPISGGLNTGQYMMVQMAKWGSGLASHTWNVFLDSLDSGGLAAPPTPQIAKPLHDLILMHACAIIYNYYQVVQKPTTADGNIDTSAGGDNETITETEPKPMAGRLLVAYSNSNIAAKDLCGYYTLPTTTTDTSSEKLNTAKRLGASIDSAVQKMQDSIYKQGQTATAEVETDIDAKLKDVYCHIDITPAPKGCAGGVGDNDLPYNDWYLTEIETYRGKLNFDYSSAPAIFGNLQDDGATYGWAMAGAWFNTIARLQAAVEQAAHDAVPATTPPDYRNQYQFASADDAKKDDSLNEYMTYQKLLKIDNWMNNYSPTATQSTKMGALESDAAAGLPPVVEGNDFIIKLFNTIEEVMANSNLTKKTTGNFDAFFADQSIGKSANPLAELASKGQNSIVAAFDLLAKAQDNTLYLALTSNGMNLWGTGAAIAGATSAKEGLSGSIAAVMSIAVLFASVLFTVGVTLGFVLPLLPFTLFFFNVLSWVVSVFEAVVSMPLWALAHLTTKGEGLPGGMAEGGYFFIFAIFLRPVLMIFGLMAGLLIFFVAISFLNATYAIAVAGAGNFGGAASPMHVLSNIIWIVLYGVFCYISANSSFKTINFFSEHAMRWMSKQGPQTEKMGDKGIMNQATQAMTTVGAQQTMGAAFKDPITASVLSDAKEYKDKVGAANSIAGKGAAAAGVFFNRTWGAGGNKDGESQASTMTTALNSGKINGNTKTPALQGDNTEN